MQKLFVHIGLPKTGSTSIQNFCLTHREKLQQHGLFYPPVEEGSWGHSHISKIRYPGAENSGIVKKNIKSLIAQCKDSECENVLVSEEIFCEQLCSDFADLFYQFDTKVIVYLRSPIFLEHSAMQFEAISYFFNSQSPIGLSPFGIRDHAEVFMHRSYSTYYKLRSNWLNHFDEKNVFFKDFEKITKDGDLVKDFLKTFQIYDIEIDADFKSVNQTLKPDYLLFHSHCNTIPLTWVERTRLYDNLLDISFKDDNEKKYRFFSDEYLSKGSDELVDFFNGFGRYINKTEFYQSGLEAIKKKEYIPYKNLPATRQHDIFSRLDCDVRQAISRSLWRAGAVPSTQPLFSDLPETKEELENISAWHRLLNMATR